jgi:hypothetical protein
LICPLKKKKKKKKRKKGKKMFWQIVQGSNMSLFRSIILRVTIHEASSFLRLLLEI